MKDGLDTSVREALDRWRVHLDGYKELEEFAERNPAVFANMVRELVANHLGASARTLRDRFGVQGCLPGEVRVLDPQRTPDAVREFVALYNGEADATTEHLDDAPLDDPVLKDFVVTIGRCANARTFGNAMIRADRAAERVGEDRDRAVCDAFLTLYKLIPPSLEAGVITWSEAEPVARAAARQRATMELAGWVVANTSLSKNKRLKAALSTGTGSPFENLLQEASAATFVEWSAGGPEEFKNLVNRVTQRLEEEGSQAAYLEARGKLADTPSATAQAHGADEHALEEFLLREELSTVEDGDDLSQERQTQILELLVNEADLSEQEGRIIRLSLIGYKQRDIAHDLGVTEGTVKTAKHRALNKLKQAAGR